MSRLEAILWASVVDSGEKRRRRISAISSGGTFVLGVLVGALSAALVLAHGCGL